MSYKNTMKLFVSNFALAWKQLVYLLCCVFLFALCSYTLVSPIVTILKDAGLGVEIKNLLAMVYNSPADIPLTASKIIELVFNSIISNFSKIYLIMFVGLVFCILVPFLLIQISMYNISSILHQKLTMNMEVGYTVNCIKTLPKSIKFALANIVLYLPFTIINIGLLYAYILVSNTFLKAIVGLIVLSAITILVNCCKITLFTHYTGNYIENDINPFRAFFQSFKLEMTHFWKIMGSTIIVFLTLILINGVIAIFTFFAGLLFTVPATFVLLAIYKLVIYFNTNGNRYYLSSSVIYNPQKYVIKKDDYVSHFVPPEETKEITTTKMKKKFKKTEETLKENKKKSKKEKGNYGRINKQSK